MSEARSIALRALAGAGAVLLAFGIAGCEPSGPADQRSDPPRGSAAAPSPPAGEATAGCDTARELSDEPSADDGALTLGPLHYPGLGEGYRTEDGLPLTPDDDGRTFYKIGVELEPGAEATVSIGAEAREYAGIVIEGGPDGGYSQVTYASCDASASDAGYWWVGGFILTGRDAACVPIEVTTPDEPEPQRVEVELPVGACE